MCKRAVSVLVVILALSVSPAWGGDGPKVRLFNQLYELAPDCVLWSRPSALENGVSYYCEPDGANFTASIRIDTSKLCRDFQKIKGEEVMVEELAISNSLGFTQAEWRLNYGADSDPMYGRGAWDEKVCLLALSSDREILKSLSELWW